MQGARIVFEHKNQDLANVEADSENGQGAASVGERTGNWDDPDSSCGHWRLIKNSVYETDKVLRVLGKELVTGMTRIHRAGIGDLSSLVFAKSFSGNIKLLSLRSPPPSLVTEQLKSPKGRKSFFLIP